MLFTKAAFTYRWQATSLRTLNSQVIGLELNPKAQSLRTLNSQVVGLI
jgi:hypothetical protein